MCDAYLQCRDGYRREFAGSMQLDNVELRYFGQNNLRAGLELVNLGGNGANVSVTNVAMNRGYFRGIDIQNSDGANIDGNLIFRSHLPALRVDGRQRQRDRQQPCYRWHLLEYPPGRHSGTCLCASAVCHFPATARGHSRLPWLAL